MGKMLLKAQAGLLHFVRNDVYAGAFHSGNESRISKINKKYDRIWIVTIQIRSYFYLIRIVAGFYILGEGSRDYCSGKRLLFYRKNVIIRIDNYRFRYYLSKMIQMKCL